MNILQQEDLIRGTPDHLLVQEAQNPSGAVPQFLVISEIQRRKDMRQRFEAEEEQPQQTVAEQIVSEAVPPQGIAALSPQMPPQAPAGAMPPQMPPEMMPSPQMPPQMPTEMMAAQMAPSAPQPQQAMMAGGGLIPGSIMEDASKFSPESLYDVGPMQQSAMANATNMGIPSVLPMAGGGVVRMDNGGRIQAIKDATYERYYGDDDKFNVGTALLDAASFIPVGGAIGLGGRAAWRAHKVLTPKIMQYLKSGALQKKLESGIGSLGRGIQRWTDPKISPLTTRAVEGPVIAGSLSPTARALSSKRILGTTAGYEGILNLGRLFNEEGASEENNNEPVIATKDQTRDFLFPNQNKYQGGIVKMQDGFNGSGQVPFLSINDVRASLAEKYMKPPEWLDDVEGDVLNQEQANLLQDYTSQAQEIDTTLFPERKVSFEEIVTDLENQNQATPEVIGAPDVPVLQTGEVTPDAVGVREIPGLSDLVTPDQDTELKTARERLTGLMGQEVEPYDPTELLLKSQERADQRAINQALINFGAGIARGDAASGLEKAGESVASIKDRQELLEQQLQTRRGEAQVQAQKDQIARDIAIAQADIGAIESDKDYQDKLIGRQLQYEGLLLDARTAGNDASIKQFTAQLAANKFLQDQSEFNRTLDANLNEQEQLNYRQQLATLTKAFEGVQSEILQRSKLAKEDGTMPTWSEVQAELEAARKSIFGQIVALKDQGTGWELPENLRNTGSGEIQIISSRP